MKDYLGCIKQNRGQNAPCRDLARRFLQCRMDNGLMGQDEFKSEGRPRTGCSSVLTKADLGFTEQEIRANPSP